MILQQRRNIRVNKCNLARALQLPLREEDRDDTFIVGMDSQSTLNYLLNFVREELYGYMFTKVWTMPKTYSFACSHTSGS